MSWDIFVQDLPRGVKSTDDIPDDFEPQPVGERRQIIESLLKAAPFADVSDPTWVRVVGHGVDMEVSLGENETVETFAFHVRGGDSTIAVIAAILEDLKLRALDPQSGSGFFDSEAAVSSLSRWIKYRDQVIGK